MKFVVEPKPVMNLLAQIVILSWSMNALALECDPAVCVAPNPAIPSACTISGPHSLTSTCTLNLAGKDVTLGTTASLNTPSSALHCTGTSTVCTSNSQCTPLRCSGSVLDIQTKSMTILGSITSTNGEIQIHSSGGDIVVAGNSGSVAADGEEANVILQANGTGAIRIQDKAWLRSDNRSGGGICLDGDAGVFVTSVPASNPSLSARGGGNGVNISSCNAGITLGPGTVVDVRTGDPDGSSPTVGLIGNGAIVVDGMILGDANVANMGGADVTISGNDSRNNITINGTILASTTSGSGDGGTICVDTPGASDIVIGPTAVLRAEGLDSTDDSGTDGTITIGPACNISVAGTLDTKHAANAGGLNVLSYRGTLNALTATVTSANNGPNAGNRIECRSAGASCASTPQFSTAGFDPDPVVAPTSLGACVGCGNFVLDPGEDCDDGNQVDNDACPNNCLRCGNGILDPGEQCDDHNRLAGDTCDPNCRLPGCGNSWVGPGEECDDGNAASGDGCSSSCMNEGQKVDTSPPGAVARFSPGIAAAADGTILVAYTDTRNYHEPTCYGELWARTFTSGSYGQPPVAIDQNDYAVAPCGLVSGLNMSPSIVATPDNQFVVAWSSLPSFFSNSLWARVRGSQPVRIQKSAFRYDENAPSSPSVSTNGTQSVDLRFADLTSSAIHGATLVLGASPSHLLTVGPSISFPVLSGPGKSAVSANNLLAWIDGGVYAGYSASGFFSARVDVGGTPSNLAVAKRCCSSQPTGAVITWTDKRTGNPQIMGRVLGTPAPGGSPTFSTGELAITTSGSNGNSAVAQRSDGNFLVTWVVQGCGALHVLVRYYSASGTPLTEAIDYGEAASDAAPKVTALPSGEFAVVWTKKTSASLPDVDVELRKYSP